MKKLFVKIILFTSILIVYLNSTNITQTDSELVVPTAISIINEGNLDINEFVLWIPNLRSSEKIGEKIYNSYPLGEPIIAVPFVYILSIVFEKNVVFNYANRVERFIASTLVAISSLLVVEIMLLIGLNQLSSIFIALIFAFSTSAWSTASSSMWQHGPTILMFFIIIWIALKAEKKESLIQYISIPLAFSYICRPTNALLVVLLTILIVWKHRKFFFKYMLWAFLIAIPFLLVNWINFGHFLSSYYRLQLGYHNQNLLPIISALLFSPSRGFFLWHPIFLLSAFTVFKLVFKKSLKPIEFIMVVHFSVFTLLMSSFSCWWGSHCIGPRFFSDMVPYGIYFLGVFVKQLDTSSIIFKRVSWGLFFLFFCIGCTIHGWVANNPGKVTGSMEWNAYPENVDQNSSRVWDIKDAQFLRGTRFSKYSFIELETIRLAESNKDLIPIDTIQFNSQYPKVQFTNGWWFPEAEFRYSQSKSSGIFFKVREEIAFKKFNKLILKVKSITGGAISVKVNEYKTSISAPPNQEAVLKVVLPENCLRKEANTILFEVDKTMNYNIFDTRDLAFAFFYLTIE